MVETAEPIVTARDEAPQPKSRLTSLDAFRGVTVTLMLLVNNLALDHPPPQLVHAPFGEWARLTDLVFPWFLLCAGLSLPFSYRSARRRGATVAGWVRKAATRTLGLLALGMLLDSAINQRPTFGLGVLQLIGLASFVAALVMPLRPLARALIGVGLLAAYGGALAWIPVPTEGRPILSEHVNIVLYLNDSFFRPIGLRGLPSVIPTAALVILGSLIGVALMRERRVVVILGGVGLTLLGGLWSVAGHPMSKEIWTAPYILFAGGLGAVGVGLLAWIFDGRPWAKYAAPLNVFGANPLVAYAGPIFVKVLVLQVWTLDNGRTLQQNWLDAMQARFGQEGGGWAYTLGYIALTWVVLAWMRSRNVTLRL